MRMTNGRLGSQVAMSRLGWADVAKTGAILLVVIYHVGGTGVGMLTPGNTGLVTTVWSTVNTVLLPTRMPLFFLVSGVLATAAITRPWTAVWRGRIANMLWPFILWTLLYSVLYGFLYARSTPVEGFAASAVTVFLGGNAYWFLAALVFFFCTARLLRRFPRTLLFISIAAWLCAPLLRTFLEQFLDPTLTTTVFRWCTFLVWFVVGCFARRLVERVAALPAIAVPLAMGLYGVVAVFVYSHEGPAFPWVPVLNILGIVSAVTLSAQLATFAPVRRVGGYLARRTLPIYLLHPVLLAAVILVAQYPSGTSTVTPDSRLLNIALVPALVAALVLVSVKTYDLTLGSRFEWLFRFPGGARKRRIDDSTSTEAPVATSDARSV